MSDAPSWDDTQSVEQTANAPKWEETLPHIDSGLQKIKAYLSPAIAAAQLANNLAPWNKASEGIKHLSENAAETMGGMGVNPNVSASIALPFHMTPEILAAMTMKEPLVQGAESLANKGSQAMQYFKSILNAGKNAEAAAPVSILEEGLNAKAGLASETGEAKALSNKLFNSVPKDVKTSITTAKATADTIINEIKDLPKSFQNPKIMGLVGDIQNVDQASIGTIQAMRSTLSDIAVNGEGVEKVYAARLSKALDSDIENFGKTELVKGMPAPPSQQPTLEARDLRDMWTSAAGKTQQVAFNLEDVARTKSYLNPETFQKPVSAITNSDIPDKIKRANAFYKDFMELQNHPVTQSLNRARPEEMAAAVFKRGNVQDVRVAQATLGQTAFNSVRRQFFDQIMNKKDIGVALGKYSDDFLHEALGDKMLSLLKALDTQKNLIHKMKVAAVTGAGATSLGGAAAFGYKMAQ